MWADTDFDEPLNYEKRAPFPTINLLRAAKIREFTSEVLSLPLLSSLSSYLACLLSMISFFPSLDSTSARFQLSIMSTLCFTYCVISSFDFFTAIMPILLHSNSFGLQCI
jgi:hypothetical protein